MKPRLHYMEYGGLIHYGRYLYLATRVELLCALSCLIDEKDVRRVKKGLTCLACFAVDPLVLERHRMPLHTEAKNERTH